MDEAVLQWFRNEHKLEIGLGMSEKIKKNCWICYENEICRYSCER